MRGFPGVRRLAAATFGLVYCGGGKAPLSPCEHRHMAKIAKAAGRKADLPHSKAFGLHELSAGSAVLQARFRIRREKITPTTR
jgi:hypothetical protein